MLEVETARADLRGQAHERITIDSTNDSCITGCHHGPLSTRGARNMECSIY